MRLVFLADAMLKKLARMLRIFGFPTFYAPDFSEEDEEILRFSLDKSFVLLTSDKIFFSKARDYVRTILITKTNVEEQIVEAMPSLDFFEKHFLKKTFCPLCGSELKKVGRKEAKDLVEAGILKREKWFWKCVNRKCKKTYWRGSHWKGILETAKKVRVLCRASLS